MGKQGIKVKSIVVKIRLKFSLEAVAEARLAKWISNRGYFYLP